MKTVKCVFLEGMFPELPAAHAYQQGRGEGASLRIAASRAISDLFKKPKMKSRRITGGKITLSVGQRTLEMSESPLVVTAPKPTSMRLTPHLNC